MEELLGLRLKTFRYPLTVRAGTVDEIVQDEDALKDATARGLAHTAHASHVEIYQMPMTLGELLDDWNRDTAIHSSMTLRKRHPNYPKILAFGDIAVRYLLLKMAAGEAEWGYLSVLREITGVNPCDFDHAGYFDLMVEDWLMWAEDYGKLDPLALEFRKLPKRQI